MPIIHRNAGKAAVRLAMTLAIALAASACTQAVQEPRTIAGVDTERQCFFTRQINGYGDAPDGPGGEERLIIETGHHDRWLFEVRGACPELDFAMHIALDTRGSSSVCTGNIETLLVPSSMQDRFDRCPVRLLGKMLEEDEDEGENEGEG